MHLQIIQSIVVLSIHQSIVFLEPFRSLTQSLVVRLICLKSVHPCIQWNGRTQQCQDRTVGPGPAGRNGNNSCSGSPRQCGQMGRNSNGPARHQWRWQQRMATSLQMATSYLWTSPNGNYQQDGLKRDGSRMNGASHILNGSETQKASANPNLGAACVIEWQSAIAI